MSNTSAKPMREYTIEEIRDICRGRECCTDNGDGPCPFLNFDGVCSPGNIPSTWNLGPKSLQELGADLAKVINGIFERIAEMLADINLQMGSPTDTITFTSKDGQRVTIELDPDDDDDEAEAEADDDEGDDADD